MFALALDALYAAAADLSDALVRPTGAALLLA
jgi:hypothetical protein